MYGTVRNYSLSDDKYFSNMNLIFEDKIGIIYADIQEILIRIYEYLKKVILHYPVRN